MVTKSKTYEQTQKFSSELRSFRSLRRNNKPNHFSGDHFSGNLISWGFFSWGTIFLGIFSRRPFFQGTMFWGFFIRGFFFQETVFRGPFQTFSFLPNEILHGLLKTIGLKIKKKKENSYNNFPISSSNSFPANQNEIDKIALATYVFDPSIELAILNFEILTQWFVIYDPKKLRNYYVYFANLSRKTRVFRNVQVGENSCAKGSNSMS